mmetsp:Transcript_7109/g.11027  ORF Transcript_7109/g.11027 Transcript_7109/m.11027 type:complete len:187 (-) Transcript_7109:50-610(-)
MWVIWMLLGSATASEIEKIGSLIQCDVCRDVAAHLKHELESWRPLKITEASVRELVTQVCHGEDKDSFVSTYSASHHLINDESGARLVEKGVDYHDESNDLIEAIKEDAVFESCYTVLSKHNGQFVKALYKHGKQSAADGNPKQLDISSLCEFSCRSAKAFNKKRKRKRKHRHKQNHGSLHHHDDL